MVFASAAQITWNDIAIGPLGGVNRYLPVQSFSMKTAVKIEADSETGRSKVTGHELQEVTVTLKAMRADAVDKLMSADPCAVYEQFASKKGQSGPLYITAGVAASLTDSVLSTLQTSDWTQIFTLDFAKTLLTSFLSGVRLGDVNFKLTAVELDALNALPNGTLTEGLITLTLTEDAAQRQSGGLKVFVNDKDITESISVHGCMYENNAEGCADTLELTFADTKNEWAAWKPSNKGDTVKIEDGSLNTGKMYIDRLDPKNGVYTMMASSVPKKARAKKSRSYEQMTLPRLASKIAADNGLECKTYSVPEVKITYLSQQGISDLAFLQKQCDNAGCSFLVFDGALCVYSQLEMEGREPSKTLQPGSDESCTVTSDAQSAYSACELSNGTYTGSATDPSITTGKIFREAVTATWASVADANSAAAARLRLLNKATERVELEMAVQRQLAAGSVVRLVCSGWTGPAFLYRVRHNLLTKRSKIWARKPLTY